MSAGRKNGGDTVLESRHVVGLFLGVVVLCGVFFTLGFVMGRTQYDTSVRAAAARSQPSAPAAKPEEKPSAAVPAPGEWQFYKSRDAKKSDDRLEPAPRVTSSAPAASSSVPAAPAAAKPSLKAPLVPRGAIVLQVAALSREPDAYALAEALQKKELPAYVQLPAGDALYRVQVGPFADAKTADAARRTLEREGFKAITKR